MSKRISIDYLYQTAVQWIDHMLLKDEIMLKDVPREIRVSSSSIYVTAFRISDKISCKRFIRDLNILCDDLLVLDKDYFYRSNLISTLSTYLSINDHKGDKEFEDFKEYIPETLLCELYCRNRIKTDRIREDLRKQGII